MNSIKVFYGFLTLVKFFTGVITEMGDPTEKLVLKIYPTLNNYWSLGEETVQNMTIHRGTWYFEGSYITLISGENGFIGDSIYRALILAWWVGTGLLAVYFIKKKCMHWQNVAK